MSTNYDSFRNFNSRKHTRFPCQFILGILGVHKWISVTWTSFALLKSHKENFCSRQFTYDLREYKPFFHFFQLTSVPNILSFWNDSFKSLKRTNNKRMQLNVWYLNQVDSHNFKRTSVITLQSSTRRKTDLHAMLWQCMRVFIRRDKMHYNALNMMIWYSKRNKPCIERLLVVLL